MHIFTFYKKDSQTRVTDCDLTNKNPGDAVHTCAKSSWKMFWKKKVDRVRFLAYYVHNIQHLSITLIAILKYFLVFAAFLGFYF